MKSIVPFPFFNLIVIGVSTGGPSALSQIIPHLKNSIQAPILIVQHMPAKFTASLAESLNEKSAILVSEAKDGEEFLPGHVYIAPGGTHMTVESKSQSLYAKMRPDLAPVNSCKPSVDVLFESVSLAVPRYHILSIILTGMGDDGKNGVVSLKKGNCWSVCQSQATCIVWGMPKAIETNQLADEVVDLDHIAERINSLNYRYAGQVK